MVSLCDECKEDEYFVRSTSQLVKSDVVSFVEPESECKKYHLTSKFCNATVSKSYRNWLNK